ncbi:MAG: endolytic transglycosylase MltG [Candidatus Gracilibacteria bacterium]|jgi:UPF0755 protein
MKFLSFLVFLSLLFVGYIAFIFPNTVVLKQDFIVNRGDTVVSIPKKLGISVNTTFFKVYTRLFVKDFNLQAGTYSMEKDATIASLFSQVLKNPTSKDIAITFLPGWNIWDMDAYLTSKGIIQSGDFMKNSENISPELRKSFPFLGNTTTLEGFLVPDTYRISPEAEVNDIIKMLLKSFDTKIYKEFDFTSNEKLYETLIFASILEKEEKNSTNKPIVAGILQKRFEEKMPIGADATVCYGYHLTMMDCTPTFIGEHIYQKNPYNTRSTLNLPPTPIVNPSIETILATIHSESSKYYYYLHDDSGNIHYGKTLEEHNRNRVLYLGK